MALILCLAPGWAPMGPAFVEGLPESVLSLDEALYRMNPWADASRYHHQGCFGSAFSRFSPADLRAMPFYHEVLRPMGVGSELHYGGFPVLRDGVDELQLVVMGPEGMRSAAPHLEAVGFRVMPYLLRTFLLLERIAGSWATTPRASTRRDEDSPSWSRDVLDCLRIGALVVDATANVAYANRAADELLRGAALLRSVRGQLQAPTPYETRRLHHLIGRAARQITASGEALSIADPRELRPRDVLVTPLPGRGASPGCALLLILPPETLPSGPAALLRSGWSLTPSEAHLVVQLAETFDLRTAAQARELSYESARIYFKRSAEKLGVRTQAEAIDLVRRLALLDDPS